MRKSHWIAAAHCPSLAAAECGDLKRRAEFVREGRSAGERRRLAAGDGGGAPRAQRRQPERGRLHMHEGQSVGLRSWIAAGDGAPGSDTGRGTLSSLIILTSELWNSDVRIRAERTNFSRRSDKILKSEFGILISEFEILISEFVILKFRSCKSIEF